jgi:mycothiol synthase
MPAQPDVTLRPMTEADVDAVAGLMAAAEAADRTGEHYDAEDLREDLTSPMTDPTTDWELAEVAGAVVAQQRLYPRAAEGGSQSISIDGVVHPDHRGQGLAGLMVPRMVARARAYAAERDVRPVLTATAPDDVPGAAEVLESVGLAAHRWTFVMVADLTDGVPPPPPVPDGYRLETWEGIDHDEIRAVHNRTFVGHPGFAAWDGPMWRQLVSEARSYRPAVSLLLRDDAGAVAAYVQTAEYEAVEAATGRRESYVAKVGTTPEHRRRGLAGVLLRHAMQRYAAAGYVGASLDVDSENPTGANSIYEGAGFEVIRRWTNFRSQD